MGIIAKSNLIIGNGGVVSNGSIEVGRLRRIDLGFMEAYTKGVIPLVCLDNTDISAYSYTSGRIEFIKFNGSFNKGSDYVDFKMQKAYNSNSSYLWTQFHRNTSTVHRVRFTWRGKPWAGLEIYSSVDSNQAYFQGYSYYGNLTEQFGDKNYTWYIPYKRTDNSNAINTEIYNSIIFDD